ncbi:MAG: ThiF family adenylyltransferase [Planctomycetota bacterium]
MTDSGPHAERFARQTRFAALGEDGQERLAGSTVLVVGAGALGGSSALWLARAGVGRLIVVDRDIVEVSNLPRQVLFTEEHARNGTPKAFAAAEALRAVGGPTVVEPHATHLGPTELATLGRDVDLVLDGTDNMRTRYLVNDWCVREGKPWVYGGVVSSGGLVLPIEPGKGPCLRCVFRDPPPPASLPTCDTAGVIGPAVGLVASMQAGLALRILAERPRAEGDGAGRGDRAPLLELDAWRGDARRIDVPRDPSCPCCGERSFPFLDDADDVEAVSLCGRNTVQVLGGGPRVDGSELVGRLAGAGVEARALGPLVRFEADGHRFTVFADGRTLVEGTEDTGRALSLVARWVGA